MRGCCGLTAWPRLQLCDWQEHRRSSDHGVCGSWPIPYVQFARASLALLPLHPPPSSLLLPLEKKNGLDGLDAEHEGDGDGEVDRDRGQEY